MNNLPIEKRYRPSNGSEGDSFCDKYCNNCIFELNDLECKILTNTMIYDKKDNEYPSEWTYNTEKSPICTKFYEIN